MGNSEAEKRIGYYLERTTRIVKLSFYKAFNSLGIDLTPEQWVILDALSHENGLSQKQLGDLSFKDAPTISRIIDVLSKKGLTSRKVDENDRRKFSIYLTSDGKNLVRKCTPLVEELRRKSWEHLDDDDYEKTLQILDQIFRNLSD